MMAMEADAQRRYNERKAREAQVCEQSNFN
jgi:hypothetical protein